MNLYNIIYTSVYFLIRYFTFVEYYSETIKHENTHEAKMCQIPDFISQDTSLWIKIHTYTRPISQIQTCGSKSKPLPETLPKTLRLRA